MRKQQQTLVSYQLSLLEALPEIHDIGVEPVPFHLSLGSDRVWIVITRSVGEEKTRFQLPVQWTPAEAAALLYEIRSVPWQMGQDSLPVRLKEIISICEQFCKHTSTRVVV